MFLSLQIIKIDCIETNCGLFPLQKGLRFFYMHQSAIDISR